MWCRHSQTSDQSCWFNHFFQVFQVPQQVTSMESHQAHDKKGIYTKHQKYYNSAWHKAYYNYTQTASSCCAATVNIHWMRAALSVGSEVRPTWAGQSACKQSPKTYKYGSFSFIGNNLYYLFQFWMWKEALIFFN